MKFNLIPIKKIDSFEVENEKVYDLQVKKNHSYCVANNIVVHNSVCKTRRVTGVGYPMLSAIIECANAAHNLNGYICADGGCREPGDLTKGFCAGADFVMIAGMVAGTDECQGEWIEDELRDFPAYTGGISNDTISSACEGLPFKTIKNNRRLKFFGMSSHEAMEKFNNQPNQDYRASEGTSIWIDSKGPVENVLREILGGLRSCGTYIGAKMLKDFPNYGYFVRKV